MSNAVLIIGESGTGKSTSIRTLPPEETFIINVLNKPLPFRGASKKYTKVNKEGQGNYFATDSHDRILTTIQYVNNKRPDIKYLVIDDFGYTIANSFMRKAMMKGYDKFTEIGFEAWDILNRANEVREDLMCFIMMHSDTDAVGKSKPKTIGKMLDEKVCVEGMFTICLHSHVQDGEYFFITNHDGHHMAKSPLEMFAAGRVPNDLKMVADTIHAFYNEDIQQ
jgi:adenylate kinase family enzyme